MLKNVVTFAPLKILKGGVLMGYKFAIFRDVAGQHRFRFVAPNGQVMATSEGYSTKQACKDTVNSIKQHAANATVIDNA